MPGSGAHQQSVGYGRISASSLSSPRRVCCVMRAPHLYEFSSSAALPDVWFPEQLSELLIKRYIHVKEMGLSPSSLLLIFSHKFFHLQH